MWHLFQLDLEHKPLALLKALVQKSKTLKSVTAFAMQAVLY